METSKYKEFNNPPPYELPTAPMKNDEEWTDNHLMSAQQLITHQTNDDAQQQQSQKINLQSQSVLPLGPIPAKVTCPNCNEKQYTFIKYQTTYRTHAWALILCLIGCIPCMWLPYYLKTFKNIDHYCSACNAFLGTYAIKQLN